MKSGGVQEHPVQYDCLRHGAPDLETMQSLWRRLPGGAVCTPFQTPSFLDAFQHTMLAGVAGKFTVHEIRRGGTTTPLLLIPVLTRQRGPIRIASMPDLALADQSAPVLSRAYDIPEEHFPALWSSFQETLFDADVLDFYNIPPMVQEQRNPLYLLGGTDLVDPQLKLEMTDEAVISVWRRKSVFKELRSKFRKLENAGVTFFIARTKEEREVLCRSILQQKQERFDAIGRENFLSDEIFAEFYLKLAGEPYPKSPAMFFGFRKGDEVVAATMAMLSGTAVQAVLLSIGDARWHPMSPGVVLLSRVLDWAQSMDFASFGFGTGTQRYKQRFGATSENMKKISLPLSRAGRAYMVMKSMKDSIGQNLVRASSSKLA